MKHSLLFTFALTLASSTALAEECKIPPQTHSKEFEKLKSLEGRWEGSTMQDGKAQDITVTYHTTSGGAAVVETLFPGTPHEMVSIYHDERGKLAMTHYCMLGNRPDLTLSKSSPTEFNLELAKNSAIKGEDHMHALRMVFIDNDNIVEDWSGVQAGKPMPPTVMKFSRVK